MTRTAMTAPSLLFALAMTATTVQSAHAAQNHNSSRSNRVSSVSGGSVDIVTACGTGLALAALDELGAFTAGAHTHLVIPPPPGGDPALAAAAAPIFPLMDFSSLWGIDPDLNTVGRTGILGTMGPRTTLSEQSATTDPMRPQSASVESMTMSHPGFISTTTELQAMASKKAEEPRRAKEAAIAGDFSRTTFTAFTDASIALSMTLLELSVDIDVDQDGPAACGVLVAWSFGTGSIVGESMLFSNSWSREYSVDAGEAPLNLLLLNETVYDLSIALDAGQQYWFSVDTYVYSALVPTPGALGLLGLAVATMARRRRLA